MITFSKDDFGDFEATPEVASKSVGAMSDGELTFAFPEVLDVIHWIESFRTSYGKRSRRRTESKNPRTCGI
jgi:hypothetical protein